MFSKNLLFLLTLLSCLVNADHRVPWGSLKDVHATLEAPQPTLATRFSFGTVTFKLQTMAVEGHSVYRGYDAAGTMRAVVVSSPSSASASFLHEGGSVTLTATPTNFTASSSQGHKHKCATQDPQDPPVDDAVHRFRSQDTTPDQSDQYQIDGFIPITTPYLRNFRIVYSTSKTYLDRHRISNESFTAQCILATEVINTWLERDLGIHLVYIKYIVAPENLMTNAGATGKIQDFYDKTIEKNAYDIGLFIEEEHPGDFNGLCQPFAYTRGGRAKCFSIMDHQVMAHELGHYFGATHTFSGNKFEIGGGFTIMSYGYKQVYALGSVLEMAITLYRADLYTPFDKIVNTNRRPKIASKGLNKTYKIPPSTPFRLTIDANDPDDDDQLLFFAQQLNYDTGILTPGRTVNGKFIPGQYILPGKATFLPAKEVTMNRTFYFQNYSDGFLNARILNSDEFKRYDKKYDIFLQVVDKNDVKKNAYYSKYDEIIRTATLNLIKNNDSEAFNRLRNESVSAITSAPWLPQRDYFHVEVLVETEYAPFVLNIEPMKTEYTAGDEVTLSWTYDQRVISDEDHVTIRLSTDMKRSFPYTVVSGVPAKNRSIKVRIPSIPVSNSTESFRWYYTPTRSRGAHIPQGFFSVEHDEGIVFATTFISGDLSRGLIKQSNPGGFNITLPSSVAAARRAIELQPEGAYVVNTTNANEILSSFFVHDKKNNMNVTSASYVLVNGSTGKILGHYNSLAESAVLSTLGTDAGRYMKLAAIVKGGGGAERRMMPAVDDSVVGSNAFTMQLNGYGDANAPYVTNFVDLKLFSEQAIEEGKSEEEKEEENSEGNGNGESNGNGNGDSGNGGNANGNGEETTDTESVIEVQRGCDNNCGSCDRKVKYIADGQCHSRDTGDTSQSSHRYYRAESCTGTTDESLRVTLHEFDGCSDNGVQMDLSSSCSAE